MFIWYIGVFLFGLIIGSFLNVVIYRLQIGDSAFQGRSYCPSCKHKLVWQDLIPLVSFAMYRGKCRYCHGRISLQYPFVELATGVIFLLIISNQFLNVQILQTFYLFTIASLLIVLFVYDLKHYILPDKILLPAIGIVVVYQLFVWVVSHWELSAGWRIEIRNFEALANPLFAGALAASFFLAIFLLSRGRAMGFGDVKLAVFMGLFLSLPHILVALFAAFFLGSIIGVGLILLRSKRWRSEIPFGPFLIIGTFVAFLWGKELVDWYYNLLLV